MNDYRKDIILQIESAFGLYFITSKFALHEKSIGEYTSSGNYISKAINHIRTQKVEVDVLNWFDDFWLYFTLRIDREDNLFLSLSIFQGDAHDLIKTQLFRAEWDNYSDNIEHPQPHWHIYPFKYDSTTYTDFETFLGFAGEESFEDYLNNAEGNKLIDISSMHFALNGQWYEGNKHIHTLNIKEGEKVFAWVSGLLSHIKNQLEHVRN